MKIIKFLKRFCPAMCLLSISLWPLTAQTPPIQSAMTEADGFLQAQKWPEAAKAYEALTKTEPNNGRAWYQLGWARHGLGEYQEAIDAFQKALEINKSTPRRAAYAMYGVAVMYAG